MPTARLTLRGGAGWEYSLDGVHFSNDSVWHHVPTGVSTLYLREQGSHCETSRQIEVDALPKGPMLAQAEVIIARRCALSGCHSGFNPKGGLDYHNPCDIVRSVARIAARALQSSAASPMPPDGLISPQEQQVIRAWIQAGGGYEH